MFQTYWGELADISQDDVLSAHRFRLRPSCRRGSSTRSAPPTYKDRLRINTEELIKRGGFGSPTMFVDGDDMYFGNDRLQLIEAKLAQ